VLEEGLPSSVHTCDSHSPNAVEEGGMSDAVGALEGEQGLAGTDG